MALVEWIDCLPGAQNPAGRLDRSAARGIVRVRQPPIESRRGLPRLLSPPNIPNDMGNVTGGVDGVNYPAKDALP